MKPEREARRVVNVVALAIAIYAFAAWVYVAAVALGATPERFRGNLPTSASWPRTDTFGELSFVISFVAFIVFGLTRR